jgi:magnesium-transporting ATPase (P-type)
MLTGDNHLTATQVAHAVGILLAKDKIAIVRAVANSLEIEDVYLEEMGLN